MAMPPIVPLTQEIIDQLKSKHGEVRKFSIDKSKGGQEFLSRGPSEPEFDRALDKINDGGRRRSEGIREVGRACLVFPDEAIIEAILLSKPGLTLTAGDVALEIAGVVNAYAEKV